MESCYCAQTFRDLLCDPNVHHFLPGVIIRPFLSVFDIRTGTRVVVNWDQINLFFQNNQLLHPGFDFVPVLRFPVIPVVDEALVVVPGVSVFLLAHTALRCHLMNAPHKFDFTNRDLVGEKFVEFVRNNTVPRRWVGSDARLETGCDLVWHSSSNQVPWLFIEALFLTPQTSCGGQVDGGQPTNKCANTVDITNDEARTFGDDSSQVSPGSRSSSANISSSSSSNDAELFKNMYPTEDAWMSEFQPVNTTDIHTSDRTNYDASSQASMEQWTSMFRPTGSRVSPSLNTPHIPRTIVTDATNKTTPSPQKTPDWDAAAQYDSDGGYNWTVLVHSSEPSHYRPKTSQFGRNRWLRRPAYTRPSSRRRVVIVANDRHTEVGDIQKWTNYRTKRFRAGSKQGY